MKLIAGLLVGAILRTTQVAGAPSTWVVCPPGATDTICQYTGNQGIQAAVDHASDGDTISIRPGTYAPDGFRDIPYKELTIRGYVVVENKDLSLVGEAGTVLDGTNGQPASAVVVNGGQLTVKNLTLRNFRAASPQDNIYDGHGLFFIDAGVTVSNVTIESIDKMALTERGNSTVDAANIRILDGQVGIWLEESSHLRLRNSVIRDNQSAGICAYSNSSANIYNSVFDGNQDDGIYSEGEAAIYVTNSIIMGNKPYGIRAIGNSRIAARHSILFANQRNSTASKSNRLVRLGPDILEVDPRVDGDYKPLQGSPVTTNGDPEVRNSDGSRSKIGLRDDPGKK